MGDDSTAGKRKSVRTLYLPNTSPVPNFVLDDLLADPRVPHAAIRVLLFLLRKTIGWSNRRDEISLVQIQSGACVSRPIAIHAIRVVCDCWGLFRKSRGRLGQHCSGFEVGELTAQAFDRRAVLIEGIYQTIFPSPKQLRAQPCTSSLLAEEQRKLEAERAAQ